MNLPQGIESKFRFILVAAKRARQLQAGAKPLIQTASKKVTKIVMQEVEPGLVPLEVPEVGAENDDKKSKGSK